MKRNQKGFDAVSVIVTLVLGILVGCVALYAWQHYSGSNRTTIDSFEACKAAGNPIMESYPEQCAADGKTFTNPDQSVN